MHCSVPAPFFILHMVVENMKIGFIPSLEEVEKGIIGCFDALMTRTASIHDVAAKVDNICARNADVHACSIIVAVVFCKDQSHTKKLRATEI